MSDVLAAAIAEYLRASRSGIRSAAIDDVAAGLADLVRARVAAAAAERVEYAEPTPIRHAPRLRRVK